MVNRFSSNASFYASVALYAIYIVLINWTTSARRMNSIWLYDLFSIIANIVLVACCLLILYKVIRDFSFYARHKWFSIFTIGVISFLAIAINSISIVLPFVLGFVALNTNNKITASVIVKVLIGLLVISSIFSLLGLNGGDYVSKPLFGDDSYYSTTMSAFGLSNPNSVMLIFINVIALSLYLCKTKKQSLYASVVLGIGTIGFSNETGSTTGLIIGLATILLVNAAMYKKKVAKLFRKFTPWALVIFTALTFLIATNFGPADNIPNPVNDALTTRPYMWNLRVENESYMNIYGNNDQYEADGTSSGATVYSLDNMTLYILVQYGIIVYLIFFYTIYSGSKKIKDPALLVYIFIACALMIVERMYLYSFFLIFLQKEITEYYLLRKDRSDRRLNEKG